METWDMIHDRTWCVWRIKTAVSSWAIIVKRQPWKCGWRSSSRSRCMSLGHLRGVMNQKRHVWCDTSWTRSVCSQINLPSHINCIKTTMKLISFLIATSVACSSFVHGQQTASPNFEFVGNGWCLDSQNTVFSWITLPGFPFANNCSDFCLQNPNYLRGFTYRSGDGRCYCHYEASQLPSPPAGSGSVVHTGTGAVDRASFDPDRQCYRYPIVSTLLAWFELSSSGIGEDITYYILRLTLCFDDYLT